MTSMTSMTRATHFQPLAICAAIAASLLSMNARAQSLVELYDSAKAFDAGYQSARLQYDANLARAEQARAGINFF